MGLFAVDYHNVPGQYVYAEGGLKFRADEEKLRSYFAPILPYMSLNDLIGEALFWTMFPATVALWFFPFLLYFKGFLFALIFTVALYLIVQIAHLITYFKPLNYVVFIFGNKFFTLVAYIVWATILIITGSGGEVFILGAWFVLFALGLEQLILAPILLSCFKIFLSLPPSDQILRNVGWYYGKKFGENPSAWSW